MRTKIGILAALLMLAIGQVSAAEKIICYPLDALGSAIAATDESGQLAWKEAYKPYGERIRKEAGGSNSQWYTGKQEDNGLNAYAANNPYKYVDPDGNTFLIPFIAFMVKKIASSVVEYYTGVPTGVKGLATKSLKALVKKGGVAKRTPQSLVERGAYLVKRNGGKNRVSISTPNGRTNIDLAGKSHNVNGVDVPTLYVQDFKNNLIPSGSRAGQVGSRSKLGDTRAATAQDLRTVDRFLKS